jgi:hypothetical protein
MRMAKIEDTYDVTVTWPASSVARLKKKSISYTFMPAPSFLLATQALLA